MSENHGLSPDGKSARFWTIIGIIIALTTLYATIVQCSKEDRKENNSDRPSVSPSPETNTPIDSRPKSADTTPSSSDEELFLSKLEPQASDDAESGAVTVDGQDYPYSVKSWHWNCHPVKTIDYVLPGDWKIFRAHIGITKESDTNAKIFFSVYLDGHKRGSIYTTRYRESTDIKLDISGAQRLRLESEIAIPPGETDVCNTDSYAAWGNARVIR